jgi:hypothetical protein
MTIELTAFQQDVLRRLGKRAPMVAHVTEEYWRRGEAYYIDSRVSVSKILRRDFKKGNEEAAAKGAGSI